MVLFNCTTLCNEIILLFHLDALDIVFFNLKQNSFCFKTEKDTTREIKEFKDNLKNTKTECSGQNQSGKTKGEGIGGKGIFAELCHVFLVNKTIHSEISYAVYIYQC